MCQTLFFIPSEVAGWPLFGNGILLAVWAVFSVILLARVAWRQGWNADTWSYVLLLLMIGAIIRVVLPAVSEPRGLPIRGYGVMNMVAVVAATMLAAWRAKRVGLDVELIYSLAFWMLIPGIIGARAFYVIEYWPEYAKAYTASGGGLGPLLGSIINISQGGLVVYGSFFGAVAGTLAFIRKYRVPLLPLCDLVAPCMALGVGIGRIGCLLNGCCFGAVCDHGLAIQFPPEAPPYYAQVQRGQMYGFTLSGKDTLEPKILAVRHASAAERAGLATGDVLESINGVRLATNRDAYGVLEQAFQLQQPLHIQAKGRPMITVPALVPVPDRSLPVYPTQIYSVIDGLALCVLLLIFSRFYNRDGQVFALLLSIYPITRFYIETLRTDEAAIANTGMSISQNISLGLLTCAAALWIYTFRQPKGFALQRAAAERE